MEREFGSINKVNIRSIWADEAREFTPWLAENLDGLGATLGIDLEMIETEANVGDFSVDILAKDLGSGHTIIIENQFGPTNHDHLGKLITYGAGFDASAVVWIFEEIREEHRQALEWLNQRTDTETQFFGIVIEVIRIDESHPAYNFRPVVFPNEWRKSKRSSGERSISPKIAAYRDYFQKLIDELREEHRFTAARIAQPQSWYGFSSGIQGISYGASFAMGGRVRSEIYIDKGDYEDNKNLFDTLFEMKDELETTFGAELEWERLDDKRASRIAIYRPGSIDDNTQKLNEYRDWMIENLLKFMKVFSGHLNS